jgi:transcription-repair coupling factor (superfamily II helicase)
LWDVGFGKTEVAIRAAFKAVDTTSRNPCAYNHFGLPALPHFYRAFKRYAGFHRLNRFRTAKQKQRL